MVVRYLPPPLFGPVSQSESPIPAEVEHFLPLLLPLWIRKWMLNVYMLNNGEYGLVAYNRSRKQHIPTYFFSNTVCLNLKCKLGIEFKSKQPLSDEEQ